MFPESQMFSKILDSIKADVSKSNIKEKKIRAKSSVNRKNLINTRQNSGEIKNISIQNSKKFLLKIIF